MISNQDVIRDGQWGGADDGQRYAALSLLARQSLHTSFSSLSEDDSEEYSPKVNTVRILNHLDLNLGLPPISTSVDLEDLMHDSPLASSFKINNMYSGPNSRPNRKATFSKKQ